MGQHRHPLPHPFSEVAHYWLSLLLVLVLNEMVLVLVLDAVSWYRCESSSTSTANAEYEYECENLGILTYQDSRVTRKSQQQNYH
jgi:hypothetical protein